MILITTILLFNLNLNMAIFITFLSIMENNLLLRLKLKNNYISI